VLIRQLTEPEQLLAHGTLRPLAASRRGGDGPLALAAPDGHALLAALQRHGKMSR
jgi:hypothetical protein